MINLKIIIASTRAGRKGPVIARWVYDAAGKHGEFDTELIDLAEINLPFLDEPNHPRYKNYEKRHTKDWSARMEAADAFIIVTCEYNHGYPAPLKNAFDFLYHEWAYKPAAFVSYGGISGGTRAVQLFKPVTTALGMVPLLESVNIPFFAKQIDPSGKFIPGEAQSNGLESMFRELSKWGSHLQLMRNHGIE